MEGGGAVNVLARLEEVFFFDTVLADFLIRNASKEWRCSTVHRCLGNVGTNHLESWKSWKVLFPEELLQTASSAGIMDQIKAPDCALSPLLGCVLINCWHDRCGMDLPHLHPREE